MRNSIGPLYIQVKYMIIIKSKLKDFGAYVKLTMAEVYNRIEREEKRENDLYSEIGKNH